MTQHTTRTQLEMLLKKARSESARPVRIKAAPPPPFNMNEIRRKMIRHKRDFEAFKAKTGAKK